MTAYKNLLSMIETAIPADGGMLDHIDGLVWDFVHGNSEKDICALNPIPDFTRSRDALKAIRPEGWRIKIEQSWPEEDIRDTTYCCELFKNFGRVHTEFHYIFGKTEELAELHAIIQAIEYERTKK